MATPKRNTVDYFPHIIGFGKKMDYIERKYKNDGYATWFKILESLATTDNHFLNLNNSVEVSFLAARCNIDELYLLEIIEDLVRLDVFNKKLWEYKVIWSEFFINSIQDAYKRRSTKPFTFESLCNHIARNNIVTVSIMHTSCIHNANSNDIEFDIGGENANKSHENAHNYPQSKVEYSKVEESKREREKEVITPTQNFSSFGKQPIELLKKNCSGHTLWLEQIAMKNSISIQEVQDWFNAFVLHLGAQGKSEETEQEFKRYCASWIASELRQGRKPLNENKPASNTKIPITDALQQSLIKKHLHHDTN